jgi:hypothetical protein
MHTPTAKAIAQPVFASLTAASLGEFARPTLMPELMNCQTVLRTCISHFPFGFSLEHFQALSVVDSSITPSQSPAFDDLPDIS